MPIFLKRICKQRERASAVAQHNGLCVKGGEDIVSEAERFRYHTDREIYSAARVRALESLLIEKGVVSGDTVDSVLKFFEMEMGPFNGAKIVARAWVDSAFKARLLQ